MIQDRDFQGINDLITANWKDLFGQLLLFQSLRWEFAKQFMVVRSKLPHVPE